MALRPEKEAEARAVFDKWDLDFAVVGETIAEDRFLVAWRRGEGGPAAQGAVGRGAGVRPAVAAAPAPAPLGEVPAVEPAAALLALMGRARTLQPGLGLDAVRPAGDGGHPADARLRRRRGARARHRQGDRLHLGRDAALLPRRSGARRRAGGGGGLSQPDRHRRAAAGRDRQPELRQPRAAGDHGAVRRLHPRHRRGVHGARHADRLGQRQPLQRDRRARDPADADDRRRRAARLARAARSAWRRATATGCCCSARPAGTSGSRRCSPSSSAARKARRRRSISRPSARRASFVRQAKAAGLVAAAHDLSDGGLAVAAAEMALAGGVGVEIVAETLLDATGWFFGEDQGRYLLACRPEAADQLLVRARAAAVPLRVVGEAGGERGAARRSERSRLRELRRRMRAGCRGFSTDPCRVGAAALDSRRATQRRRLPDGDGSGGHRATDPRGVSRPRGSRSPISPATATTTPPTSPPRSSAA